MFLGCGSCSCCCCYSFVFSFASFSFCFFFSALFFGIAWCCARFALVFALRLGSAFELFSASIENANTTTNTNTITITATTITRKNTNCKLAAAAKCTHQVLAQFSSRSRSHTFPCPRQRQRKSALFSEKIVFLSPRLLTLFFTVLALSLFLSPCFSRSFSLSISLCTFSGDFHFWLALLELTFPPFTVHVAKRCVLCSMLQQYKTLLIRRLFYCLIVCLIKKIYIFLPRPIGMCTV